MNKQNILLLPGYDGSGEKTFRKLVPLLSKNFKVVTVDYPYLTDWNKQYCLDELVEYVDKLVEEKAVILGFSMGGFIASKYANKYPEKVEKLILVSTATTPRLDQNLKVILEIASVLLKSKILAKLMIKWFLQSNLKNFPLPKPGKSFKVEQGYATFGSLAKVMKESKELKIEVEKLAILFDDDNSFPAKVYEPILRKQGFTTKTFQTGGHAETEDYWEKVAKQGLGLGK